MRKIVVAQLPDDVQVGMACSQQQGVSTVVSRLLAGSANTYISWI